jgi:hypothetical protein
VRDADSKQPIPGAQARISYPLAGGVFAPRPSSGGTGNNGVVHLSAAVHGDTSILLELDAEGYLEEHRSLPVEMVRAIKPAGLLEAVERRPVNLIVEMYAEKPVPTIDVVLPNGYRGMVQLEISIADDASQMPGHRQFSYAVPASGSICVREPALLRRFTLPNVTARYAEGTPLGSATEMKESEIGFWRVKHEYQKFTFLVGSKAEYEQYRSLHPRESSDGREERRSTGNLDRGGGRGRGRRTPSQPESGPYP